MDSPLDDQLDPAGDDAEVYDLAELVETMAQAFRLDEEEYGLLLRLAMTHDFAQHLIADVLVESMERGDGFPQADDFALATPPILDALHADLVDARDDLILLARPSVAVAFATVALGGDVGGVLGLQMVVDAMTRLVPYQARPALEWLRGRGADRAGYGLDAEAAFEAAVGLDPTWGPALESLAALVGDRGDAERALSLLDRAGVGPEDGLYQLLTTFRSGNVLELRRNDPCWCGSGRRLKQCHRGAEPLPLSRRASWLYHKASAFLQDGPWRMEILELAGERSRYGGERERLEALGDPLVMSSMLFEGGVLEEFADTRGSLLPEDEYALLLRWINADRGLFEVEDVVAGEGMRIRNVLDGERTYVHEVLGSSQAYQGMLFVSLVLPVDEVRFGFFGGIEPVSLTQRAEIIDLLDGGTDPLELVAAMTDRFAPMQFRTSDGDDLEPSTCVIKVKGRKVIGRAFDAQFRRDSETAWTAGLDGRAIEDGATIGGSLELNGRLVTINTMSRLRMDLLLDVIAGMGFEFSVISETTIDVHEALAERRARGGETRQLSRTDDPEIAEMMEQYILTYEAGWLEESIPALDGLTPRQAAQDPIARRDLIALLNSFPPGAPGTMSPERLRAALGL